MMSPNDGVHPPPEGHGADVGDQATHTMIAELLEDDIRRAQTVDTIAGIEALRMTPHEFSRMKIPLCRLVPMPMVRPTLASDLIQLEQRLFMVMRRVPECFMSPWLMSSVRHHNFRRLRRMTGVSYGTL